MLLDTKSGTLLGYDTTFKQGDFYVSILVFRHAMFNESPVIPVAFLTHDGKFQKMPERFFLAVCGTDSEYWQGEYKESH